MILEVVLLLMMVTLMGGDGDKDNDGDGDGDDDDDDDSDRDSDRDNDAWLISAGNSLPAAPAPVHWPHCAMASVAMKTFLALLLQELVRSEAEELGHCDSTAYLQMQASNHSLIGEARACDLAQLNSGLCLGTNTCQNCGSGSDLDVPPGFDRFPQGFLKCEGQSACRNIGQGTYVFKNGSDYWDCTQTNACRTAFVRNAGAACFQGDSAGVEASIELTTGDSTCYHDVCCMSDRACQGVFAMTGVRSLICKEGRASGTPQGLSCYNFRAVAELTGDLICDGLQVCGSDVGAPRRLATFSGDGQHNVLCRGERACENVVLESTSANATQLTCDGPGACAKSTFFSSGGGCLKLICLNGGCVATTTTPSPPAPLRVLVPGGTCYCESDSPGACASLDGTGCGGTDPLQCVVSSETRPSCAPLNSPVPDCSLSCPSGDAVGDPHLTTMDGKHYTLMKQGSFLLWSFSGVKAEILAEGRKPKKKAPVNMEIFTHYAGQTSFTKGLVLVDKSTNVRRGLEITSRDCIWRTDAGGDGWRLAEGLLKFADAEGDDITAFRVSDKAKPGKAGANSIVLLMNSATGFRKVAQLRVKCRPGHHLDAKITMASAEEIRFVKGELGPDHSQGFQSGAQKGLSLISADEQFVAASHWTDLGGSPDAATYLRAVDSEGPILYQKKCPPEEQETARKICKKHFPEAEKTPGGHFEDCLYDVCSGGGEAAAELAAELMKNDEEE
eukprot:s464_g13.t1